MLAVGCGPSETGTLTLRSALKPAQTQSGDLVIDRAHVAASEIELEGGKDDEREAEMGESEFDIALDGAATDIAVESVEAGAYHTLGIEFTRIEVDGTYQGRSFSFAADLTPEVEFPIDPELDVPVAGQASASIAFDVAKWFDGADPTDAGSQGAIEQNITTALGELGVIEDEANDDD